MRNFCTEIILFFTPFVFFSSYPPSLDEIIRNTSNMRLYANDRERGRRRYLIIIIRDDNKKNLKNTKLTIKCIRHAFHVRVRVDKRIRTEHF